MKRSLVLLVIAFVLGLSCNKSSNPAQDITANNPPPTARSCASYDVLEEQLKQDPTLLDKMNAIERFTRDFENNTNTDRLLSDGTLEVPVVVNVLYRTAAENISNAQINSQLTALNKDYAGNNSDYNQVPSTFTSVRSGNTGIKFVLQNVVRKQTSVSSWSTNDAMKKNQRGGIDPTSPVTTLNIWVCSLGNGILGYAQFPGGKAATDGVVILNTAFGTIGTAQAPFDKGRTATHEIGHYFNLRHIWGDSNCGNDYVSDTPLHDTYNFGCPSFPDNSNCGGTTHPMMTMNYMDYTDDPCMFMFTLGQKTRMQATYAVGGPRASLR
jgi:hypothetical protein